MADKKEPHSISNLNAMKHVLAFLVCFNCQDDVIIIIRALLSSIHKKSPSFHFNLSSVNQRIIADHTYGKNLFGSTPNIVD